MVPVVRLRRERGGGAPRRTAVDGDREAADEPARWRRCTRRACPGSPGSPQLLQVEPSTLLKSIAFDVDGKLGLAVVPGDREVNEYALAAALRPKKVRLYGDEDFAAHPELAEGLHRPALPGRRRRGRRPERAGAAPRGSRARTSPTITFATR